jgi:NAD kinase
VTAEQAKLQTINRQLQKQLKEFESNKGKNKITVDPNTLFANVDTKITVGGDGFVILS